MHVTQSPKTSSTIWWLQEGGLPVDELDAVVDSISSPQELFAVLNEQLSMVQGLSEEIRDKGLALQHSEEARCVLARQPSNPA